MKMIFDLAILREANNARQNIWCELDRDGVLPDITYRAVELGGECGEALNVVKKLERERLGWRGSRATLDELADEIADVIICADLLASAAGIDLAEAVRKKFNASSEKLDLPIRIDPAGSHYVTVKLAK